MWKVAPLWETIHFTTGGETEPIWWGRYDRGNRRSGTTGQLTVDPVDLGSLLGESGRGRGREGEGEEGGPPGATSPTVLCVSPHKNHGPVTFSSLSPKLFLNVKSHDEFLLTKLFVYTVFHT